MGATFLCRRKAERYKKLRRAGLQRECGRRPDLGSSGDFASLRGETGSGSFHLLPSAHHITRHDGGPGLTLRNHTEENCLRPPRLQSARCELGTVTKMEANKANLTPRWPPWLPSSRNDFTDGSRQRWMTVGKEANAAELVGEEDVG